MTVKALEGDGRYSFGHLLLKVNTLPAAFLRSLLLPLRLWDACSAITSLEKC